MLHTLSFIYQVQRENESVYFAYDEPYTYSQDLKKYLDKIRNDPKHSDKLQISHLCKSLGGADVKLLTITD